MADRSAVRVQSLVTEEGKVEVSLAEGTVRDPAPDEVIVRVEAAPINPSDLAVMFAFGDLGRAEFGGAADAPTVTVPLSDAQRAATSSRVGVPIPLGNEGAGTVVATGEGEAARALAGRVVSVSGGGLYSSYRRVRANLCLPLADGADAADGAAAFVNPMTALGMVETMRLEGHQALVHTAAGSGLGRMLARLCADEEVPLVNVVRSPAQAEALRADGAEFVCDSSGGDFEAELTAAVRQTGATLAFDAIGGGDLADRILACMERALSEGADFDVYGSAVHKQVYLYGNLDRSATELRRTYGMSWGVGGWLMPRLLQRVGPERVEQMRERVTAELKTTFATDFTDRVTLSGALSAAAVGAYGRPKTGTKFLVTPSAS
ncbi:MAG: NADH oxidase [Actinobacteria bacterium]|nr:NADH oxidase [Actinomycetota bacterium]